jgi:hypothetical protein
MDLHELVRDAARARQPHPFGPWSNQDVARLLGGNALGLLLVLIGWYQASGASVERTQLAWVELGIAGVIIAGLVDATWLLRGRSAIHTAVDVVIGPVVHAERAHAVRPSADTRPSLVWVPNTSRYHRPDCPLTAGKETRAADPAQQRRLAACEVCIDN